MFIDEESYIGAHKSQLIDNEIPCYNQNIRSTFFFFESFIAHCAREVQPGADLHINEKQQTNIHIIEKFVPRNLPTAERKSIYSVEFAKKKLIAWVISEQVRSISQKRDLLSLSHVLGWCNRYILLLLTFYFVLSTRFIVLTVFA